MTNLPATRLRNRQYLTLALMVVGYAGYYLCRSNLSATLPLISEDLAGQGFDAARVRNWLAWAMSLGTIGYAIGKFAAGTVTDLLGGRRNYLIGMAGAVVCTGLFAIGGSLPLLSLIWFANRLIQSLGWPGMIKIISRWFSYSSYNTVMGVVSLSFLFGDAAARLFIGLLIESGLGWRGVFLTAAAVLAVILLINFLLIRESPGEVGLPEPETTPDNLFGELGQDPNPDSPGPLVATLARSPAFWIVCLISLGLTLLREVFNNWTPTYLVEAVGLGKGNAAKMSSLFPLFGGVSVILAGYLGDRLGRVGRASIILIGLLLGGLALALLGSVNFAGRSTEALLLVSLVAFLLIGPYSYLAGAISLDFGGKRGGATACGIIDGVGYLFGGVIAGSVVGNVSDSHLGWQRVFQLLAIVAFLTSIAAAGFLVTQWQRSAQINKARLAIPRESSAIRG